MTQRCRAQASTFGNISPVNEGLTVAQQKISRNPFQFVPVRNEVTNEKHRNPPKQPIQAETPWYLGRYESAQFLYRSNHRHEKFQPYRPVRYRINSLDMYLIKWLTTNTQQNDYFHFSPKELMKPKNMKFQVQRIYVSTCKISVYAQ